MYIMVIVNHWTPGPTGPAHLLCFMNETLLRAVKAVLNVSQWDH